MSSDPRTAFLKHVPHAAAVGMEVVDIQKGVAIIRAPYDAKLVGNPDTGVVHGGVITTLLDNACGIAVTAALGQFRSIATLDLRIDYMKPATPGEAIQARAECYKLTRNIAFTRAVAYHSDPADPIASAVGSFMLDANDGKTTPPAKGA